MITLRNRLRAAITAFKSPDRVVGASALVIGEETIERLYIGREFAILKAECLSGSIQPIVVMLPYKDQSAIRNYIGHI